MSKVYSFRLDENNPHEAQAREVIDTWVKKGYPLRYVITEALLNYLVTFRGDAEVYSILEEIKGMIS